MFSALTRFAPIAKPGATKYGPMGLYTISSLPTSVQNSSLAESLVLLANHSITKHTWSAYKTAGRMLSQCFQDLGQTVSFPLNQNHICLFVGWLHKRKLASSTISSYLAGLRQLHLTAGLTPPIIRSDLVKQILSGKIHHETISPSCRKTRLPVTPTILRLLKLAIAKDSLSKHDARLFWLVCSLAFHGAFRMGELLTRSPTTFDPNFCLLNQQVSINSLNGRDFLEVSLSSTKTSATRVTVVDIFPTHNDLCPVKAFTKWSSTAEIIPTSPVFRLSSGKLLTPTMLNKKLKLWLKKDLDFSKCSVSGHSFRAGLVSVLSNMGFREADLKVVGRWSSRAYELYTKLPRTRRRAMAEAMGNIRI